MGRTRIGSTAKCLTAPQLFGERNKSRHYIGASHPVHVLGARTFASQTYYTPVATWPALQKVGRCQFTMVWVLGSTPASDGAVTDAFSAWLDQQSITRPKCKLAMLPHTGRGVVATSTIEAGEVVVEVCHALFGCWRLSGQGLCTWHAKSHTLAASCRTEAITSSLRYPPCRFPMTQYSWQM